MFKEPLLIEIFAPDHPGADEDGSVAMRLEISAASLDAWLPELGWKPPAGEISALDRLRALRCVREAFALCSKHLLEPIEMELQDEWIQAPFQSQAAVRKNSATRDQQWAEGDAPLPGGSFFLKRATYGNWKSDAQWPQRAAKAAEALGRGFGQFIPGPPARVSNAKFDADRLEHTLAAYEPQEILRKGSVSMRGFALVALASLAIAKEQALAAANGDAALAQGPDRAMDPAPANQSVLALSRGAAFVFSASGEKPTHFALATSHALSRIAQEMPLARALHFSDFGELAAIALSAGVDRAELSCFSFSRSVDIYNRQPAGHEERVFPRFGLSLRSVDPLAAPVGLEAAWSAVDARLRDLGFEVVAPEMAASLRADDGKPYDHDRERRIHEALFGLVLARETRAQLHSEITRDGAAEPGAERRKPRSL